MTLHFKHPPKELAMSSSPEPSASSRRRFASLAVRIASPLISAALLLAACSSPTGTQPTGTSVGETRRALGIIEPCAGCLLPLCGNAGEAPCDTNGTQTCSGWTEEALGATTCTSCGQAGQVPCNTPLSYYAGETGCEGWFQPNASWYDNPTCVACGGSGQLACNSESGSQESGCQSGEIEASGSCTPCGGIDEPACSVGSNAGCQAGLTNLSGTCGVPPAVLNMGSVNVTGPVTTQGLLPWTKLIHYYGDISAQEPVPAGGAPYPSSDGTQSSLPSPRWVPGSGFTVTDPYAGQAAPPKLFVPTPSLTLQAEVSFTDDTSAVAGWYLIAPACDPTTFGGNPQTCPVPQLPPPAPLLPWWELDASQGLYEGNHAHYTVTVQRWVDGATGCSIPPAAPDLPSPDPDFQGVYNGLGSPDTQQGCWPDYVILPN